MLLLLMGLIGLIWLTGLIGWPIGLLAYWLIASELLLATIGH